MRKPFSPEPLVRYFSNCPARTAMQSSRAAGWRRAICSRQSGTERRHLSAPGLFEAAQVVVALSIEAGLLVGLPLFAALGDKGVGARGDVGRQGFVGVVVFGE